MAEPSALPPGDGAVRTLVPKHVRADRLLDVSTPAAYRYGVTHLRETP